MDEANLGTPLGLSSWLRSFCSQREGTFGSLQTPSSLRYLCFLRVKIETET